MSLHVLPFYRLLKAMDYNSFMNKVTRNRNPSYLRQLFDGLKTDESHVVMASGLPDDVVFPVKSAKIKLSDGSELEINEVDMTAALQYGVTAGNPELLDWVTELNRQLHDPPTLKNPDHPGKLQTILTCGAQDAIYKAVTCLLEEGDTILTEEPVYSSFLNVMSPVGCNIIPVEMDKNGIVPERLKETLVEWSRSKDKRSGGKIKGLYMIPNGGNPTGTRYSLERKKQIYRLAQEYNFLIWEDEAYFFLEERPLSPSFLSMDVDGRVVRFDTFSKTIAPGLRIGYVSGPKPIVEKMLYLSQSSNVGCSGISQALLIELLRKWGHEGYLKHCEWVGQIYAKKRDVCIELAKKHLDGLATWHTPTGGMFLWMEFTGLQDSFSLVMDRLLKRKVLLVAGGAFNISENKPCPYARVAFSRASAEEMEKGFKIIAEELRALRNLRK